MANSNTTIFWNDLPTQVISTATETALVVPAQSLNYGTLPSPAFAAGNGLTVGFPPDLAGNPTYDTHAFKLRLVGKATTAGSYTVAIKLYQVPGSIVAAGTAGTLANDHVIISLAATTVATATQNFFVEATLLWDSTSKILNGFMNGAQINGVGIAVNSGTASTQVATTQITAVTVNDLNFIPSFTLQTANGANSVTVTELSLDRA